jgi:hypothetical protein
MRLARRLLAAALLLVVAIGAPAAAWAAFSTTATGSVRAGTLLLKAPASASGSFNCPARNATLPRGGVVVSGWDSVVGADSYTLTLDPPGSVTNVVKTATASSTQTLQPTTTPGSGTWTLTIVARAGTWTGPGWKQVFTC